MEFLWFEGSGEKIVIEILLEKIQGLAASSYVYVKWYYHDWYYQSHDSKIANESLNASAIRFVFTFFLLINNVCILSHTPVFVFDRLKYSYNVIFCPVACYTHSCQQWVRMESTLFDGKIYAKWLMKKRDAY